MQICTKLKVLVRHDLTLEDKSCAEILYETVKKTKHKNNTNYIKHIVVSTLNMKCHCKVL